MLIDRQIATAVADSILRDWMREPRSEYPVMVMGQELYRSAFRDLNGIYSKTRGNIRGYTLTPPVIPQNGGSND